MRDPMTWALTVFRVAGVPVRVHAAFFVFVVGLVVRQLSPQSAGMARPVEVLIFSVPVLFLVALLHDLGKLAAARFVDGDCRELVLWPLGGLAQADVPRDPRAHAVAALGGPAANLALCLVGAVVLAVNGYLPNLNPVADPYVSEVKSFRDGRVYTSAFGVRLYEKGTATPKDIPEDAAKDAKADPDGYATRTAGQHDRARLPGYLVWANRVVWLSYVMLLLNLLPGLPLAFGGVLEAVVWWRTDHAQGVTVSAYAGYVVAAVCLIGSLAANEVAALMLAMVVAVVSLTRLRAQEAADSGFGDFSQGYASLDGDDIPPPRPKRQPFVKRWLTARAAKRMLKENEARQREDDRMDQLLDKIHQHGKLSLTDEERRFLERVSARHRNRN